jgi:hypothetical protein
MPHVPLDREEYIEQAYFFRVFRERLYQNIPSQDILASIHEEVLSSTKLPMAIDFLKGEALLNGRISDGMARLTHYFAPFQAYVIMKAEEDRSKFDQRIALEILEREATYRANAPVPAGLFVYQFECLSRNKLGYDKGMLAMADDPVYDENWADWIRRSRLQLGAVDFTDLIYYRSEQYLIEQRKLAGDPDLQPRQPVLFGAKEGRIARANAGKDPLFMFAALQRQLGYPTVPRPKRATGEDRLSPTALDARLRQMEKRLQLLESEMKGNLDLSQFYAKPQNFADDEPEQPPHDEP